MGQFLPVTTFNTTVLQLVIFIILYYKSELEMGIYIVGLSSYSTCETTSYCTWR